MSNGPVIVNEETTLLKKSGHFLVTARPLITREMFSGTSNKFEAFLRTLLENEKWSYTKIYVRSYVQSLYICLNSFDNALHGYVNLHHFILSKYDTYYTYYTGTHIINI